MKKYLLLYKSPVSARAQMAGATPEQAKAGMDAWMGWSKKHAKTIVDFGSPLGDAKVLAHGVSRSGDQTVGGFSIVQGESAEAVMKSLKDHPHFHTPGVASIEIHEFLSMPGM